MLLQRNPRPHRLSSRSTPPPRPVINNRFALIPEDGVNTGLVSISWQRGNEHCLVSALPASKSYTRFSKKTDVSQHRQTTVQRTRTKHCWGGAKKLRSIFQCSVSWKRLLSIFLHSRFRLGGWLMEGFFTLAKSQCHQSCWALDDYKPSNMAPNSIACVLNTNLQGTSNYTFKRDISFLF